VAEDGKLFVSYVDEYLPSLTRLFSPNRLWFARAICSICRWLPLRYQEKTMEALQTIKEWMTQLKAFGPPTPFFSTFSLSSLPSTLFPYPIDLW